MSQDDRLGPEPAGDLMIRGGIPKPGHAPMRHVVLVIVLALPVLLGLQCK
jgi:hypothetical protein